MIGAFLTALVIVAISAPIVSAFVGVRLRVSVAIALVPGLLLALAALVATTTAWGSESASSSEDVSHAYALFVAGLLALMAGAIGVCIAGVVTRARRGPGWSRRA